MGRRAPCAQGEEDPQEALLLADALSAPCVERFCTALAHDAITAAQTTRFRNAAVLLCRNIAS